MATRKPVRFKITVWHGEGKSLFYVLRNGSVVKTFHKRADAEAYISGKKTNPRKPKSNPRRAAASIPAKLIPKKGGGWRVMVAAKHATRLNPGTLKGYKVFTSFGGKFLGHGRTLAAAKTLAIRESKKHPVDIWTTGGGMFGQGKQTYHVVDGKVSKRFK